MKDRLERSAYGLSGGQQQRLCIARALAVEPEKSRVAHRSDGPDSDAEKDYTIVIVTHNMQQAGRCSDHTAFFYLGRLIEFGDTARIFSQPSQRQTEDYITGTIWLRKENTMLSKHILGTFDEALASLRDNVLMMASLTERSLDNALNGLRQRDEDLCAIAIADDEGGRSDGETGGQGRDRVAAPLPAGRLRSAPRRLGDEALLESRTDGRPGGEHRAQGAQVEPASRSSPKSH